TAFFITSASDADVRQAKGGNPQKWESWNETHQSCESCAPRSVLQSAHSHTHTLLHATMPPVSGVYSDQSRRVYRDAEENCPANTKRAYAPFIAEFKDFAQTMFPFTELPQAVTEEKLFGFMFYQAYRGSRTKTKRHGYFDRADYEKVLKDHPSERESQYDHVNASNVKYCSRETFDKVLSAILKLADIQRQDYGGIERKEELRLPRIQALRNHVQKRAPQMKAARFEEKITPQIMPLQMLSLLEPLEKCFWNCGNVGLREGMASLRNRHFYLNSMQSCVRGESMWLAELSDLFDLEYKKKSDPTAYHILFQIIRTGKTNHDGKSILGRVIRHLKVNVCGLGSLAFYLMIRFLVTGEGEQFDFRNNENWFRLKLMVEANGKAVGNRVYANAIDKHLKG
ncbi:MAG: hypothetical protein LH647_21245, partial [Leptolyngbyaceae cyanobacterium CAN_BIN12]|nr:hypothetical protein [Leptolyngbyaceae cyanobacterium CAN_BIN12]